MSGRPTLGSSGSSWKARSVSSIGSPVRIDTIAAARSNRVGPTYDHGSVMSAKIWTFMSDRRVRAGQHHSTVPSQNNASVRPKEVDAATTVEQPASTNTRGGTGKSSLTRSPRPRPNIAPASSSVVTTPATSRAVSGRMPVVRTMAATRNPMTNHGRTGTRHARFGRSVVPAPCREVGDGEECDPAQLDRDRDRDCCGSRGGGRSNDLAISWIEAPAQTPVCRSLRSIAPAISGKATIIPLPNTVTIAIARTLTASLRSLWQTLRDGWSRLEVLERVEVAGGLAARLAPLPLLAD